MPLPFINVLLSLEFLSLIGAINANFHPKLRLFFSYLYDISITSSNNMPSKILFKNNFRFINNKLYPRLLKC